MKVEERYQLAARFRRRYLAAGRAQRSELLTVFCEVTGYSRKHAVCVLRGRPRKRADGHGRPRAYSEEFTQALRVLWEATCYVCAERLQPFMGELADLLVRHHQLEISEAIRAQLDQASVSTVERHLHGLRVEVRGRRRSYGRPGAVLRREIPVLVGDWKKLDRPGYVEIDLVSHAGLRPRRLGLHPDPDRHLHRLDRSGRGHGQRPARGPFGAGPDSSAAPLHACRDPHRQRLGVPQRPPHPLLQDPPHRLHQGAAQLQERQPPR